MSTWCLSVMVFDIVVWCVFGSLFGVMRLESLVSLLSESSECGFESECERALAFSPLKTPTIELAFRYGRLIGQEGDSPPKVPTLTFLWPLRLCLADACS